MWVERTSTSPRRVVAAWFCATALTLAACATGPRSPDEGGRPWVRADGDLVTVETASEASDARNLVRDVENWRSAMATALLPDAPDPRQRLEVIVLQTRELEALNPTLRGVFTDRPYLGPVLILGASDRWDRDRIMKHELAHSVIAEYLHHVPEWLNEGLAVYLETTTLDEKSGEVTWGLLANAELVRWQAPRRSSSELLDRRPWPAEDRGLLEMSASLMVHMLARRHPTQLACLLRRLSAYDPYEVAVSACFDSRESWGVEYGQEDVASAGGTLGKGQIELARSAAALEPMTDADVHAVLALVDSQVAGLLPRESQRRARLITSYEGHLRRALALDAANVLAASMKLTSDDSDGDPKGALTARLVAAHPGDWRAWLWRADLGSTPADEARIALARAVELAPRRHEVISLQAYAAVREDRWNDAAALARKAFALEPTSPTYRRLLYVTLEHLGRCDEAKAFVASDKAIEMEIRSMLALGTLIRLHRCVEF